MASAARLRLLYFLYYGSVGAFLPYFAAYLRGLGWSGEDIGAVQMLSPLVAPVAALGWAAYADRRGTAAGALRLSTLWASSAALLLPFARTPVAVGAVVLVQSLGDKAVVPLVDSVTLEHCRAHRETSYARVRLFGSLGFIVVTLAVGGALTLRGDRAGDVLVPAVFTACVVGYAWMARRLPAAPPPGEPPDGRDVLALLRDRSLLLLLLACAIHWGACAPYHLMFGVFVRDLGLGADVTGIGMAVGVAAEILALVAFPRLERRLSTRALFAIAFVGTAIRWGLLARASAPATVISLQGLHGLTFGLFWATAMHAMAAAVPARLRATGQALFTAVVFGAGNAAGYALSGIGYDRLGGVGPLFGWAAAIEVAPLLLALVRTRRASP